MRINFYFNINLLKLHQQTFFSNLFDTIKSHSSYPRIILPLILSDESGSLLDNNYLFGKLTRNIIDKSAFTLTSNISDHLHYLPAINIYHRLLNHMCEMYCICKK